MTFVMRCAAKVGVTLVMAFGCKRSPRAPSAFDGSDNHRATASAHDAPLDGSAADASDLPYRCERDSDCITTCELGAVSAAWWRTNHPDGQSRDCEDGCASKGLVARCEHATCTTFDTRFGGLRRAEDCTHKATAR
jgi:hypothetical protein